MTKGNSVLQRILAAGLIVLGLVGIGTGVAAATLWRESETVVATAAADASSPLVVSEPGVLDLVDGDVTVTAKTPDGKPVTLVIGRDVDVTGWVGTDAHSDITGLTDWETLATKSVTTPPPAEETPAEETPAEGEAPVEGDAPAEGEAPAEGDAAADATAETPVVGVDPAGSDMWFAEASGAGEVSLRWSDRPGRWSLLAAGTGEDPASPVVTLSWAREVSTPWQWPGIAGGSLLLVAGLAIGVLSFMGGKKDKDPSAGGGRKKKSRTASNGRTARTGAGSEAPESTSTAGEAGPAAPTERRAGAGWPGAVPESARVPAQEPPTQTGATGTLTRRELREKAERERIEAERLAQEDARAQRPRNRWMTGQIPVVRRERNATAAQPVVPDPSGETDAGSAGGSSATARADAWRQAWGFGQTQAAPPAASDENDQTQNPDSTGGDR
ncbi:hypothetical protein ACFWFR_14005 [Oerskovia sp. NPDC060287]|uniref:hypothetical protein n=1 Tax=Oerskovia sp. NPDC060287 TaxID=3347095 RepID=UPI00364B09BA